MNPATLDHEGIAARVPHSGRMCLLDRLRRWSAVDIECSAISHRDPAHPLRTAGVLPAPAAIEYAAQAMALHGALCAAAAPEPAERPPAGFLASVREVRLHVPRLDEVAGELAVHAQLLAGDARQALYAFSVRDEHAALLVDGRATVILNAV